MSGGTDVCGPAEVIVREEGPGDAESVRAVVEAAFPTPAEARLVDLLRARRKTTVSLVAEADGRIVGLVLFSPVTIETPGGVVAAGLGLAPVAVHPARQRKGIGRRLIEQGIAACRGMKQPFVVVLGDPSYYQRFGFRPARLWGIANEYQAEDEFMVVELRPGSVPEGGGLAKYTAEFADALG